MGPENHDMIDAAGPEVPAIRPVNEPSARRDPGACRTRADRAADAPADCPRSWLASSPLRST